MSISELATAANDQSTYVVTLTYTDKAGSAITPLTAAWTLSDGDGTVVNSRTDVAIPIPGTTNDVVLAGDDLKFSDGPKRLLTVEGTYNSDEGSGLPFKDEVRFLVCDLTNV